MMTEDSLDRQCWFRNHLGYSRPAGSKTQATPPPYPCQPTGASGPDAAVIAIGTNVNPIVPSSTPGMDLNKWGYIIADEKTGKTTKKGVFAGGDIVTGAATVILAMGAGKNAADAIDEYLKTNIW